MSDPAQAEVVYEVSGGIATLTLNRPERLNAITRPMLALLSATTVCVVNLLVCVVVLGPNDLIVANARGGGRCGRGGWAGGRTKQERR